MDWRDSIPPFQWPKMDQFIFQEPTCVAFATYSEEPQGPHSSPPMTEPLITALRPSFILLGCIDMEDVHKSP
jgi:hypothetical protein